MNSNNQYVLYGGKLNESLEKAKSFGEFCYNRLKKCGEQVLFVSVHDKFYENIKSKLYKG